MLSCRRDAGQSMYPLSVSCGKIPQPTPEWLLPRVDDVTVQPGNKANGSSTRWRYPNLFVRMVLRMMIVMTVLAVWAWTTVSYPSPNSIPAVRTPVRLEIPILQRALRPPPLTDSVPDPSKGPDPSLPSPTPIMPAATPVISEVPASFPPLQLYAAALRPEQDALLDGLSHLPRYEIEVELLPASPDLEGHCVRCRPEFQFQHVDYARFSPASQFAETVGRYAGPYHSCQWSIGIPH